MLRRAELKRIFPLVIFWFVYTVLFFLWVRTFFYTLPFLLGLLLAAAIRPLVQLLEHRLGWKHGPASAAATAAVLAVVFGLLGFLGVYAVREITELILRVSQDGFEELSKPVAELLNRIGASLQRMDLQFLEQNREEILGLLQESLDLIVGFLGAALGVITSLPTVVTMVIVTVFATFFISRDMGKLAVWARQLLSAGAIAHMKNAAENSGGKGRRYFAAYLLLYCITFCETCIILTVLELPYPLTTGLITAAADFLPALGPGLIFVPLALYQLLTGRIAKALGLFIGWVLIALIRQIIEPKLISGAVKVHPLAMLAAVYFSLVAKSLWILLYMTGFFTLYGAFRETGALPPLLKETARRGTDHQDGRTAGG